MREKEFEKLDKSKSKKLFSKYSYIINEKIFFVFSDKLDLSIDFEERGTTFVVKIVEKYNNEKNFSFKVYRAILDKTKFNEIETGDALSIWNLKAHMNASTSFMIFLITRTGDEIMETPDDILNAYKKDKKEPFVLKESSTFSILEQRYGSSFDEYLEIFNS